MRCLNWGDGLDRYSAVFACLCSGLHDYVPGSRLVRTQTRLDVCLQLIMLAHSG